MILNGITIIGTKINCLAQNGVAKRKMKSEYKKVPEKYNYKLKYI